MTTTALPMDLPKRKPREYVARDWKVTALREMPLADELALLDTPDKAAEYWHAHVASAPWFNGDVETLVVLHLNTRRRVTGHHVVSTGTLDTILCHAREVFRAAIVANAAAIIVMHNHPSGEHTAIRGGY